MDERDTPPLSATPIAVASLAEAATRLPRALLLDVRKPDAFARGHVAGAGHVAFEEFALRRVELPGRDQAVVLLHDEPERALLAARALVAIGYTRVGWLAASLAHEPGGLASREPPARLWSPSAFLEKVRSRLPRGRALDLACGSGRASVFLAQSGWTTQGWDVDPSAIGLARGFAARAGVAVAFQQVDLEHGELPQRDAAFDVIVVVRYLHRELFPWIERALTLGGALVYETFRQGQERFGHPRRARHLLEPGELARAFPSLEVELHEETPDTAPPVLARLLARRPAKDESLRA